MKTIICQVCKKECESKRGRSKYCSTKCARTVEKIKAKSTYASKYRKKEKGEKAKIAYLKAKERRIKLERKLLLKELESELWNTSGDYYKNKYEEKQFEKDMEEYREFGLIK